MTRLFLCGDVMIGRGIDQVMPRSVDARLFEPHVRSAETYVRLAEQVNGPIPRPVPPDYVWGAALGAIDAFEPDARIVNLETALTTSAASQPNKEIHYRAHPDNVAVLRAAGVDCAVLANNHALDWGESGLIETLDTLHDAGLRTPGAGRSLDEAQAPAVVGLPNARVVVVGLASTTSGTPRTWLAGPRRPGVDVIDGWSAGDVPALAARIRAIRQPGDVVVVSIHWGSNWGYEIPNGQRRLAHELIDRGGVDVAHGHSSHHPRPIERYHDRLILYGCGDFVTDYEGISGYEAYRGDLALAYFARADAATGRTVGLTLAPFMLRRFQLVPPPAADVAWLAGVLDRRSRSLGTRVELGHDGTLEVL